MESKTLCFCTYKEFSALNPKWNIQFADLCSNDALKDRIFPNNISFKDTDILIFLPIFQRLAHLTRQELAMECMYEAQVDQVDVMCFIERIKKTNKLNKIN